MSSNTDQHQNTIALYHDIQQGESALQAVTNIWNLIQDAYASDEINADADTLDLYIDIEDHRNEEGGFTEDMFLVQKQILMQIIPAFVNSVHFPLGTAKSKDTSLEEILRADKQRAEEDPNEEMYISNLDDLPPEEEFVQEMDLVASYHEESGSLLWGFGDTDRDLTTQLTEKELEIEEE